MSFIREKNGKLSVTRLIFIISVLFTFFIIYTAIFVKDKLINDIAPIIYALLTFTAGLKIGQKYGEKE